MRVNYDGTDYHGFQTQPSGNTIQDHIEHAIFSLTGETIKITASGRTDAGVHAYGQVFNFNTASRIPIHRWCLALNAWLPENIILTDAQEVPLTFHARHMAKRKTYRYSINANRFPDIFQRRTQFHHPTRLDIEAMRKALQLMVGTYDYTSFASTQSQKSHHVRTIYEAYIEVDHFLSRPGSDDQGIIHVYVTGSGFLQHMVRIIVGTLMDVGEGKKAADDIPCILAAKNRMKAGPTAVAHGLTLWNVEYDENAKKT